MTASISLPAIAGSVGGAGGALEVTQLANLGQLADQSIRLTTQINNQVQMITNQVQQITTALQTYQNLVDNTLALPFQDWGNIMGELQALQTAVGQGQSLAYSLGNVDDIVRQEFGRYQDYIDNPLSANQFSQRYARWSERNNDTIAATLEATGLNIGQFADEQATLPRLQFEIAQAQGRADDCGLRQAKEKDNLSVLAMRDNIRAALPVFGILRRALLRGREIVRARFPGLGWRGGQSQWAGQCRTNQCCTGHKSEAYQEDTSVQSRSVTYRPTGLR